MFDVLSVIGYNTKVSPDDLWVNVKPKFKTPHGIKQSKGGENYIISEETSGKESFFISKTIKPCLEDYSEWEQSGNFDLPSNAHTYLEECFVADYLSIRLLGGEDIAPYMEWLKADNGAYVKNLLGVFIDRGEGPIHHEQAFRESELMENLLESIKSGEYSDYKHGSGTIIGRYIQTDGGLSVRVPSSMGNKFRESVFLIEGPYVSTIFFKNTKHKEVEIE